MGLPNWVQVNLELGHSVSSFNVISERGRRIDVCNWHNEKADFTEFGISQPIWHLLFPSTPTPLSVKKWCQNVIVFLADVHVISAKHGMSLIYRAFGTCLRRIASFLIFNISNFFFNSTPEMASLLHWPNIIGGAFVLL
jgi:hypothetical protein